MAAAPLPPAFFASKVHGKGGKPACITGATHIGKFPRVHRPKRLLALSLLQFWQNLRPVSGKPAAKQRIHGRVSNEASTQDSLWASRNYVASHNHLRLNSRTTAADSYKALSAQSRIKAPDFSQRNTRWLIIRTQPPEQQTANRAPVAFRLFCYPL